MVSAFQSPVTAALIKEKARELGCDLVGIADGAVLEKILRRNFQKTFDITDYDGGKVIVLAKRYTSGTTRITRWDERHKYYNDELTLTMLEEASLQLVYWLEDQGYPVLQYHQRMSTRGPTETTLTNI